MFFTFLLFGANEDFLEACRRGDVESIRDTLALRGEEAVTENAIDTALIDASSNDRQAVVYEIILRTNRYDPDGGNCPSMEAFNQAFLSAARNNHLEILKIILNAAPQRHGAVPSIDTIRQAHQEAQVNGAQEALAYLVQL